MQGLAGVCPATRILAFLARAQRLPVRVRTQTDTHADRARVRPEAEDNVIPNYFTTWRAARCRRHWAKEITIETVGTQVEALDDVAITGART